MPEVCTKIIDVVAKKTRTGNNFWEIITAAGTISEFRDYKKVAPLVDMKDQWATIEYKTSGQWKNFVSFRAPTSEERFMADLDERNLNGADKKSREIAKAVALKGAIDFFGGEKERTPDTVIEVAEIFLKWLLK